MAVAQVERAMGTIMDNKIVNALHLEGISQDLEQVIRDGISMSGGKHGLKNTDDGSLIFVTYDVDPDGVEGMII